MTSNAGTLSLEEREALPPGRMVPLRIAVIEGPDRGTQRLVDAQRVLIGRGETADVRLTDPTVSMCHAELAWSGRGIAVRDLGSRNGVKVGSVRLVEGTVPAGSRIALGNTVIVVAPEADHDVPTSSASSFGGLTGGSRPMRELFALLERLAKTELSVVIQGRTGTGKEVAARALHERGRRASGPFVVLDCTAIPPGLAPSVLFGAEKGAYTGATERRMGVFEAAHGGTLFIDEVGDLPADLQPALLRALQSREVVPVGSTRPRPVNVRVIAATWRDLRAMVNRETFREDLYFRLAQATVWMPPLEERRDDIPLLVEHVLRSLPPDVEAARAIAPDALAALAARAYPGNVRELISTVQRLAMLAGGPAITGADLAFERMLATERGHERIAEGADDDGEGPLPPFKEARRTVVEEFERDYLARLIERTRRNISRAAAVAGLERHNLRELLRKHGLWPSGDANASAIGGP